jgi:metal-responsive CopG/Arc/MetJ family transcriptional regulator
MSTRSEALKKAQQKYIQKVRNTSHYKEKQKQYRAKNYDNVKRINKDSNRKRYNECEDIRERKKHYYVMNRNYINRDNLGQTLYDLFTEPCIES